MHRDKELNFFIENWNWTKGAEWYASRFPEGDQVRGESSPNYTATERFPGVPARMHSLVPDARLIYMVRDPVERLVSHWIHRIASGREVRPLAEFARDIEYVGSSLYWKQIALYLEHYPSSRILVIAMEDLAEESAATLRRVCEFLDVDPDIPLPDLRLHRTTTKRRRTKAGTWIECSPIGRGLRQLPQWIEWRVQRMLYLPFSRRIERPTLSERDRAALAERLREDTNRFREFAGRAFEHWSV